MPTDQCDASKEGHSITTPMNLRQLFVDAYDCDGPLSDASKLRDVLSSAAKRIGARPMNQCHTEFIPHGVTSVLILAESHFVISTWPEYQYASFDALLCNETMDAMLAWKVLEDVLRPKRIEHQWITRRVPGPLK